MSYTSTSFSLSVNPSLDQTNLWLQFHSSHVTTDLFPQTLSILEKYLPSVLQTECFNDHDLPFQEEVLSTEVGHLFEHILLEYLSIEATNQRTGSSIFNGRTHWDWLKHPKGSFFLTIDAGHQHATIFKPALQKSIQLMELVLNASTSTSFVD